MSYIHHTILLVDNDQDMAHFTMLALQRVGVISPVQVATNAEEAIGYLNGEGVYRDRENYPLPVLMLLDPKLPNLSGFEFLAWVRQQPELKRLPVIMLSQPGPATEVNHAYELGCNSYLTKPTSFNTLLVMMQALVQYWLSLNTAPELGAASGYPPKFPQQPEIGETLPDSGA